jgi:hypothetical protein
MAQRDLSQEYLNDTLIPKDDDAITQANGKYSYDDIENSLLADAAVGSYNSANCHDNPAVDIAQEVDERNTRLKQIFQQCWDTDAATGQVFTTLKADMDGLGAAWQSIADLIQPDNGSLAVLESPDDFNETLSQCQANFDKTYVLTHSINDDGSMNWDYLDNLMSDPSLITSGDYTALTLIYLQLSNGAGDPNADIPESSISDEGHFLNDLFELNGGPSNGETNPMVQNVDQNLQEMQEEAIASGDGAVSSWIEQRELALQLLDNRAQGEGADCLSRIEGLTVNSDGSISVGFEGLGYQKETWRIGVPNSGEDMTDPNHIAVMVGAFLEKQAGSQIFKRVGVNALKTGDIPVGAVGCALGAGIYVDAMGRKNAEEHLYDNVNLQNLAQSLGLDTTLVTQTKQGDVDITTENIDNYADSEYVGYVPKDSYTTTEELKLFNSYTGHSYTLDEIVNDEAPADDPSRSSLSFGVGEKTHQKPSDAYAAFVSSSDYESEYGGTPPWDDSQFFIDN